MPQSNNTVNTEDARLVALARKIGPDSAKRLLSVLGKNKSFYNAIETPVGQELLKDVVVQIEYRIGKILNEEDSQEIRAELRAYMTILNRWSKTISKYKEDLTRFAKYSNT